MPGIEELNKTIERFEKASATLREESRLAHEAAQACKEQRRLSEKWMHDNFLKIEEAIGAEVHKQLDAMGKEVENFTDLLYERVGNEIDKLVNTMLGKSTRSGKHEDLRPALAEHLAQYLKDQIDVDFSDMPKIVKEKS